MGWKGTVRAVVAAQRRAERASVRRQRELERQHKQLGKMQEREAAEYEVTVYENHLDVIRSVHKDCGGKVDWRAIRDAPRPAAPVPAAARARAAETALAAYTPGLLDRLLGRTERRRADLMMAVEAARRADEMANVEAARAHENAVDAWSESKALAARVLAGEAAAYREVLEQFDPFSEISTLGSSVSFSMEDGRPVCIFVNVHAEEVIPPQVKGLTQSGKLSVKKMPLGQFYELYQDYVCGCVLRIGREVFAVLPSDEIIVTAVAEVPDSATGHVGPQAILSVLIPRATMERLNFESLDPSDSMKNFVHRMDFKKTKGFHPVPSVASSDATGR